MAEHTPEQRDVYANVQHVQERMKKDPSYYEKVTVDRLTDYLGPNGKGFTWMEQAANHTVTADTEFGRGKGATHCFLSMEGGKDQPRVLIMLTVSDSKKFNITQLGTEETANRSEVAKLFSDANIHAGVQFRHWFAETPERQKVQERISWRQVQQRRSVLGNLLDQIRKKRKKDDEK